MSLSIEPDDSAKPSLGENLRLLRRELGWSLTKVAGAAGIPQSTLSKVESGQMSLNYDKLVRVASALDIDIKSLFKTPAEIEKSHAQLARRTIDRGESGIELNYENYRGRYMCTDLKNRLMIPLLLEVKDTAGSRSDNPISMMNVIGERFAYVIDGPVAFHCDHYEPTILEAGDSIYIDAAMPHAFVAVEGKRAKVLTLLASSNSVYLKIAQDAAMRGDTDATERFKKLAGND